MSCCDLLTADYRDPERDCDIVMKGGITSGVVYPHAACELAQTYRFRNIGGTSAGAIAAAGTAAAEYGRDQRGFNKLANLPDWLGEQNHLRDLFQPQPGTKTLYRLLLASLEGGRLKLAARVLAGYPGAVVVGALPGVALTGLALAAAIAAGPAALIAAAAIAAVLAGLPVIVLGIALAVAASLAHEATHAIPDNGFGLCSGMKGEGPGQKALTEWLTERLDAYAGLEGKGPLTFGHLWRGPEKDQGDPLPDPDQRWLQLAMMTTNLVNRRAHQLPWETREWFFDPAEFRRLFPEEVVAWMEKHPPPLLKRKDKKENTPAEVQESRMRRALALPKLPLPAPEDLPVVVATRMSLSYPVVLSAVPLWNFDMTRQENRALDEWKAWAKKQGERWDPLAKPRHEWPAEAQPGEDPVIERAWFSDGGISSNFPVHFFDRLVPRWPTFAINLRPFALGQEPDKENEVNNTWMVDSNSAGIADWWYRLPDAGGVIDKRLFSFLNSAVRTMQNRVDEAQMRVPGYRDRVSHVSLSENEGGMNLTMPPSRIAALTARGRFAAMRLRDAYTPPDPPAKRITWDNHRWIRLRSALSVFEEMHKLFATGYDGSSAEGEKTYLELIRRREADLPSSYRWTRRAQRRLAERQIKAIRKATDGVSPTSTVSEGGPSPAPVARITPRE